MVGRTAGLLVDLAVEVVPTGWRVTARPGRDHRRAVDLLHFDVDALDTACAGARPEWVKVQAAGPWTLAAVGRAAHRTPGAHRPRRRPRVRRKPAGGAARPTPRRSRSGPAPAFSSSSTSRVCRPCWRARCRPPRAGAPSHRSRRRTPCDLLRDLVAGLDAPVVPALLRRAPPGAVARRDRGGGRRDRRDAARGRRRHRRPGGPRRPGEVWDVGTPLLLGLVPCRCRRRAPTPPGDALRPDGAALGLSPAVPSTSPTAWASTARASRELAVPTPTCGLAGASPSGRVRAMALCRDLGRAFVDPPEGGERREVNVAAPVGF